jgi:predicted kinase
MKKKLPEPFVIMLIGPPLSGKSTWIKKNYSDIEVISRDEIVMEVYGSRDYTEAFKRVDQKRVNEVLKDKFESVVDRKVNVIVDMTNMTSKRRKHSLSYFTDDYYKLGVIFPILPDDEYIRRNEKRIKSENKDISIDIIKKMIISYQPISQDEGFDKVIKS